VPKNSIKADTKSIDIQVRKKALDLLARREHATKEMRDKLVGKGIAPQLVDDTLEKLAAEGLLSDRRFVEAFVRARRNRGYGPLHIRAELKQRGIDDVLIADFIDPNDRQWSDSIRDVWHKRFGDHLPANIKERSRQTRFLQYRGFTSEQISRLFKHVE
jgi:regulatory protein